MAKTPTLIVSLPENQTRTFELKGERIGLGREIDNQIQVAVGAVSSCHCEFRKEGDSFQIADLGSTNGTRVNGKKIEVHKLADGDRILLGETIAVHYVELAEGESVSEAAVAGDDQQNAAGASYAKFDEKLQSIQADIAAKESEREKIAAELEEKRREHDELLASMKQLENQIAAAKASSGDRDDAEVQREVAELEKELMLQTQKVQTLASDIDGQQRQMQQLVPGAPAPVLPGVPPPAAVAPPSREPAPAAEKPVIKVAAMAPPTEDAVAIPVSDIRHAPAPPAAAPPQPPAAAPAPIPVPQPLDPALATPPAGAKTVVIEQSEAAPNAPAVPPGSGGPRKLIVEQPSTPRPKLNLD